MSEFNKGDIVKVQGGGEAKVLETIGSGGQGTVYKVSVNGKEYALKWYRRGVFKGKEKAFYDNLSSNIKKGAPTSAFLWPLYITEAKNNSFGYLMEIRPKGYEELTNFFVGSKSKKQVHFKSFKTLATAAIQIANAFNELHRNGYSYQDINNGNFFINPQTGDVLICDNDNVAPFGINLGILGKQRWMAPEIVTCKNNPDTESDKFSLAVVLFRLLFINHPLEGRNSTPPCMTKELERKYYGEEPIFVYDAGDTRNRPIPGTDHNLKLFWSIYPQYIKDAFLRAFSKDVMMKKAPRVLESQWIDLFFRLMAEVGTCAHCKQETFIGEGGICIECKKKLPTPITLKLRNFNLPLHDGLQIYQRHIKGGNDISAVVAEVLANKIDKNLLGLRNVSQETWKITLPDGSQRPLAPGAVVPAKDGFIVDFMGDSRTAGAIVFPNKK